jgi:hypothetical protein
MTKIEFSGTVLAFAGGGRGGSAGTTSEVGLAGYCGQTDPSAPISPRSDEPPDYDGLVYGYPEGLPYCSSQPLRAGRGVPSWKRVAGTLIPPDRRSLGGRGGDGQFGGSIRS